MLKKEVRKMLRGCGLFLYGVPRCCIPIHTILLAGITIPVVLTSTQPTFADASPWGTETPLSAARNQFTGGVIDGRIYVFGGNGNPNDIDLKSTEMFDPATGLWTWRADNNHNYVYGAAHGVEELTSAVVDANLYVFGAYGGTGPDGFYGDFNFMERYDPDTDRWTSLAPKPTVVTAAPAAVYNGEIYLFGGGYSYTDANGIRHATDYDIVEAYNPSTDTWRFVTNMPKLVLNPAVAVIGHRVYVIGGYAPSEGRMLSHVMTYDFETGQWTHDGFEPLPCARIFPYSSAAPVLDGKVYLIGGAVAYGATYPPTDRVDIYDTVTNTWYLGPPLPERRDDHLSVLLGNRIYVIGGSTLYVDPNIVNRSKSEVFSSSLPFQIGQPGEIEFTYVPAFGSSDDLRGRVSGVNPSDYMVAVYICVPPWGWWTKPYSSQPLTPIGSDGTWTCDITTDGSDLCATQIIAFLVSNEYSPPLGSGQQSLPCDLYQYPYAEATRYEKISFSGYDWWIKRHCDPVGPGPNYFSDSQDNVWVDPNGYLHLKIVEKDQKWYCSEVIANANLGYGTYIFTVKGRADLLDENIVLGLFTWEDCVPEYNYREMDVEISNSPAWRESPTDANNAQFVVQPWDTSGNRYRFRIDLAGHPNETTTQEFTWSQDAISFQSYYGDFCGLPAAQDMIASWYYDGNDVPSAGDENPRINFWLINGGAPTNGQDAEIVVKSLRYLPIGDFCGADFGPEDGYVDVWDLMQFADHWHKRAGEPDWYVRCDLSGRDFGDPDAYVDVWDLMVFADHWHEGQKP